MVNPVRSGFFLFSLSFPPFPVRPLRLLHERAHLGLRPPRIAQVEPEGVREGLRRLPLHRARIEVSPVHRIAFPQGRYDLRHREAASPVPELLLDGAEDGEREEADEEVGLDPVLPREVHGTRLELALPDPEALLDLPASLVDPHDLLRRVFQVRADRIEAVVGRFLSEQVPVHAQGHLLRGFPVLCRVFRLDEAPRVVLVRLPLQASGLHPLQGPFRLRGPDRLLVEGKARGVGDDDPFPEPLVLEPLLLVEDPVLPFLRSPDVGEGERPLPSEPLPSAVRPQPGADLLLRLLQRLRDDESEIGRGVVSQVLPPVEASVGAYDELPDAEALLPLLLQGHHGLLLVRVAGVDAPGDRDAVPVEEPPHLDDRVRPVLLRLPVPAEAVLLLGLEEEVRAVVVDDGRVPLQVLLPSPVGLRLDVLPVRGRKPQGTVDLVQGVVRLLREGGGEGIGRPLAEGVEDAADDEVAPDPLEVVSGLVPVLRLRKGLVEPPAVIGRLREEVSQPPDAALGWVDLPAGRDLEGGAALLLLGGQALGLLLEVGDRVVVPQGQLGELPYALDGLAGGLLPHPYALRVVEDGVLPGLDCVYLHGGFLRFVSLYYILVLHLPQYKSEKLDKKKGLSYT